jgi:hypothetical protein
VFDDGSGTALYAGGSFTAAGGVASNRIARWRGGWEPLGPGTSGDVAAMMVMGQGRQASLIVGGSFGSAFESGDSHLARWRCTKIVLQPGLHAR